MGTFEEGLIFSKSRDYTTTLTLRGLKNILNIEKCYGSELLCAKKTKTNKIHVARNCC